MDGVRDDDKSAVGGIDLIRDGRYIHLSRDVEHLRFGCGIEPARRHLLCRGHDERGALRNAIVDAGLPCAPVTPLCSDAGTAFGEIQDSLTFTNATRSVQDIALSSTFDGSFTSNATAPAGPTGTFYSLFCFAQGVDCFGNANSLPHGPISTSLFEMEDSDGTVTTISPTTGWANTSITGDPTEGLFEGVFAVPTGVSSESLNAYLFISCGMATCDFSNTGELSIGSLPDGVSYTSGSGVLLTSAAPEPRSWTLVLGGVVLLLSLRRRRPA
jgi:MYXO-CTERM domain-containing protein